MLKYPPFQSNLRLLKAAENNPPLRLGDRGPAVALLQAGLVDVGFAIPGSIKKSGVPDGIYGPETTKVVTAFQNQHKLSQDGIAGKQTITTLDAVLAGKAAKPGQVKPKNVPPKTKHYQLGTTDPPLKHDRGAGAWNSENKELTMILLKDQLLRHVLPAAYIIIGDDAVKHLFHYLRNRGTDYTIDLEDMVNAVPSAKRLYQLEVAQAKEFVEKLRPGTHNITSRQAQVGYNRKAESWNWFFAVGGYSVWGKGVARVENTGGKKRCELDFEYHFYDRYNWDRGKKVTIAGIEITDEFMGKFHRQGLAREYNEVGMFRRRFRWTAGQSIPPQQLTQRVGGGR